MPDPELFANTQLVKVEALESQQYIPPPPDLAELPVNTQLVKVDGVRQIPTAPPQEPDEFPENTQLVKVQNGPVA